MKRQLVTVALALAAASAFAHESRGGHAAGASGPVTKEQQPWGIAGDAKAARRTIDIDMTDDMRFRPDRIQVRGGQTVRLRVRNAGRAMHELVIGTRAALQEHAALMQKFPGMEHAEPHMAHVRPGERGELVWNFNRPGTFEFACLVPGHFQAGMIGTIQVVSRKEPAR